MEFPIWSFFGLTCNCISSDILLPLVYRTRNIIFKIGLIFDLATIFFILIFSGFFLITLHYAPAILLKLNAIFVILYSTAQLSCKKAKLFYLLFSYGYSSPSSCKTSSRFPLHSSNHSYHHLYFRLLNLVINMK